MEPYQSSMVYQLSIINEACIVWMLEDSYHGWPLPEVKLRVEVGDNYLLMEYKLVSKRLLSLTACTNKE